MGKYSCEKCAKTFSQKSHYDKHISRKNPCEIQIDKIKALIDKAVEEKLIELKKKLIPNNTENNITINITEQMDISKMSKLELLEKCKELGIAKCSSKNKSQLIELINLHHKTSNNAEEYKNVLISSDSQITENNIVSEDVELVETLDTKFPMPQYLGSKTKYIEHILKYIPVGVDSILDAFSGSGIVSYAFKKNKYRTLSNDLLSYNAIITKALVENQNVKLTDEDIEMLLADNPLKENFIEREFTDLYYTKDECIFLDNLHSNIIKLENEYKIALAFASIGRTLIRKILFAYFCHTKAIEYRKDEKRWKRNPIINSDIKALFRKYITEYNNAVIDNKKDNISFNTNILSSANTFDVDLVYMDPPYGGTHADYGSYYHFIETYINYWKDEELFNTTKQPKNKLIKSKFATKNVVHAFEELFEKCKNIKYWMISYNSNADPKKDKFIEMIQKYKKNIDIKEISLSNNNGGMGLRKDSKEYLFICY
jgi:adenine-specific DNA methylase